MFFKTSYIVQFLVIYIHIYLYNAVVNYIRYKNDLYILSDLNSQQNYKIVHTNYPLQTASEDI